MAAAYKERGRAIGTPSLIRYATVEIQVSYYRKGNTH
jgi:hypothetical protein